MQKKDSIRMNIPMEITWRGLDKNDSVEQEIHQRAEKLERFHDRIVSCRVVVENPHSHQQTGRPYRVRAVVRVPPNKELVSKRETSGGGPNENLRTIVREAFDNLERQLKELSEVQRGKVKHHPAQEDMVGVVVRLHPRDDFGFLKTAEGRQVYFHRNAVLNHDFDRLEEGTVVRYVAEPGEDGLQATTVAVQDKPGSRTPGGGEDEEVEPPLGWEST
jgi:cold shock CspA family protein